MDAPAIGVGPEFVGHMEKEEEMEHDFVYYRPSQGKKVLVVERKKHECFFFK